jgi:hypothetical protein
MARPTEDEFHAQLRAEGVEVTKRCGDPQCPDWEHGEHVHDPWPRTRFT